MAKMAKGKVGKPTNVCRIHKNKHPTFFRGNKLNTFCDTLFRKKEDVESRKAFLAGVIQARDNTDCGEHIFVDVHFTDDMVDAVREINKVHFKFTKGHACQSCGFKEVMESPNAVAFEVEAIHFQKTAVLTTKGEEVEADYDSE